MKLETNTKHALMLISWTLPFQLLIPYALIVTGYRGLEWALHTVYLPFWIVLGVLVLISTFSSILMNKLFTQGLFLYRAGLVICTVHTTYLAMSEKRHLLLSIIFLCFTGGVLLGEHAKKVLRLAYHDSKRKWWESYPKGIPGLRVECSRTHGEKIIHGRLSNFGVEGCFVFSESEPFGFMPDKIKIFSGEKLLLESPVDAMISTDDDFGKGLRFSSKALEGDWSKDLKDYIGYLRRSGYEVN